MTKMEFEVQLFAEGDAEAATTETVADIKSESAEVEVKAEAGDDIKRQVSAAVAKEVARIEADFRKREAENQRKAELSKLSDDERKQAELESLRKELDVKAAEIKRREIELEMVKVLEQRGIPISFMSYFITDDNETTLEKIKTFEKAYKGAIESAVNEKLKGRAPAAGVKAEDAAAARVSGGFMAAIKKSKIAL